MAEQRYQCACCGGWGKRAIDETDPASDEIAIDARGLVSRDDPVCGACLESAEDTD